MSQSTQLNINQPSFLGMCPLEDAVALLADSGAEERGAVFTRREVVEFILDLIGYTKNYPLHKKTIMEPSFGEGDFLLIITQRLLKAWKHFGNGDNPVADLSGSIRAVELHGASVASTRKKILSLLKKEGLKAEDAEELVAVWLIQGDFLLASLPDDFDYVVGNPPYVRQEQIPDVLMAAYRRRYDTIYDRADLYVPFIERSLKSLKKGGSLGFICADRWMKNRYGKRLRQLVAEKFNLKVYVDMVNTQAFHEEVSAYPAITVITNGKSGKTRVAHRPAIDQATLRELAEMLLSEKALEPDGPVQELSSVTCGSDPWILKSFDQLTLVRRLERDFPIIEEAGCKVGIGVATGADSAFIALRNSFTAQHPSSCHLVLPLMTVIIRN